LDYNVSFRVKIHTIYLNVKYFLHMKFFSETRTIFFSTWILILNVQPVISRHVRVAQAWLYMYILVRALRQFCHTYKTPQDKTSKASKLANFRTPMDKKVPVTKLSTTKRPRPPNVLATKRPIYKKAQIQNVPSYSTFQLQNAPYTKCPSYKKNPRDNTSQAK
jgi:hypothetical protein